MNEEINKIKDKLMHPMATSLSIKRVPIDTVETFKQFANDEFVGDYGLCLKSLVDMALTEPARFQQIYSTLEEHEQRIAALEGKKVEATQTRKTLSGRVIKIPC